MTICDYFLLVTNCLAINDHIGRRQVLSKLFLYVVGDYMNEVQDRLMKIKKLFLWFQAHLMNNRVGEVLDEVDGLGHVHRRLQLVLLRQLQQLPGERRR